MTSCRDGDHRETGVGHCSHRGVRGVFRDGPVDWLVPAGRRCSVAGGDIQQHCNAVTTSFHRGRLGHGPQHAPGVLPGSR